MVPGPMRRRRNETVAIAMAALALARGAAAETAPPPGSPAVLEWNVAPNAPCLGVAAFREGVERALSRPPFAPDGTTPRALRVGSEIASNSTTRVVMTLKEGDHEIGSRSIEVAGTDCKKSRETVVLVAAMLLDVPSAPEEPKEEPKPPAPSPPPPVVRDTPRPPPPGHSRSISIRFEAGLAAAVTTAFLPRFGLGGRAEVLLDLNDVPRVRFTAGVSSGATVEASDGTVDFLGTELTLGAIPLETRFGPGFQTFAFVSVALTAISASASGFGIARSETLWVASAVLGGALRYRPFDERFLLSLEAAGLVPFARPQFAVLLPNGDELEVHRVGAFGVDIAVGAGWQFR